MNEQLFNESHITHDPAWEVLPSQLKHMLDERAVVLLDCREPEERSIAAITPSVFIPMGETIQRLHEIEDAIDAEPTNTPAQSDDGGGNGGAIGGAVGGAMGRGELIVYCHHGRRSFQVTAALREQGITNVRSLAGGIDAWSVLIDQTIPRY